MSGRRQVAAIKDNDTASSSFERRFPCCYDDESSNTNTQKGAGGGCVQLTHLLYIVSWRLQLHILTTHPTKSDTVGAKYDALLLVVINLN